MAFSIRMGIVDSETILKIRMWEEGKLYTQFPHIYTIRIDLILR